MSHLDSSMDFAMKFASLLSTSSDASVESVYSDPALLGAMARAELAAREADLTEGFPISQLDPEHMDSVRSSSCDVVVAAMRLPYARFDELMGEPDESFALRAAKSAKGLQFEIMKLGKGDKAPSGWLEVPPVASASEVKTFAEDLGSTLNEHPFAEQHHAMLQAKSTKQIRFVQGSKLTPDQVQDQTRFVLARTWAMNLDEKLVDHAFKAAHGMDRGVAVNMAAVAFTKQGGDTGQPLVNTSAASLAPKIKPPK